MVTVAISTAFCISKEEQVTQSWLQEASLLARKRTAAWKLFSFSLPETTFDSSCWLPRHCRRGKIRRIRATRSFYSIPVQARLLIREIEIQQRIWKKHCQLLFYGQEA